MPGPPLLAALGALITLALPSTAWAADLTIKVRDRHISELGGFRTSGGHGTLGGAIRAWGRPSSRTREGNVGCKVGWSSVGVKATFANFGGGSGCSERLARLQTAKLRSKRWTTERGLHVGDPSAKLKQLHPEAKFAAGYFLLYTAPDRYGTTGLDLPVVAAQMKGGAVRQYLVEVLAAGD